MNTPICDFVKNYAESSTARMHMPGHKGVNLIGCEELDITEINGADSLYEASGIISESEENASSLFGCHTFYSCEGSSLSIRAMMYLASLTGKKILAARNVHKTFLSAVALLDLDVEFLPCKSDDYLSADIPFEKLEERLKTGEFSAVYVTSPDYLGKLQPIKELAEITHKYNALLLVDNAHGAYLKFLKPSIHPIDLGADICCDSAHKTLPCLTGTSYLHISKNAPKELTENARHALSLFGSTSPSYLLLQSLDAANPILADFSVKLSNFTERLKKMKKALNINGYKLFGDEKMKLTIDTKAYGYTGVEFSRILRENGVEAEFADPDYLVLMPTPYNSESDLDKLQNLLLNIPKKKVLKDKPPIILSLPFEMSIRKAMLGIQETVKIENAENRILAQPSVGCPPAVPIAICGQRLNKQAIECFRYYGIDEISVVKE